MILYVTDESIHTLINKAITSNNLEDFWTYVMSPEAKLKNVYEANMKKYMLACKQNGKKVCQSDLQDIIGNAFLLY